MKLMLVFLLAVLALNVLVILVITGILVSDYLKNRRRGRHDEAAKA